MIYFDAAATTLEKPDAVCRAMASAMATCANPGRSGHRPALRAAETVYNCRQAAAELFGLDQPERVIFTQNATHGLNIAIKSLLRQGGHAVISGYEHNSVARPLEAMADQGVTYTAAYSPLFDPDAAYRAILEALRPDTCCVIVNQVSNVFGFQLPVQRIDGLCRRRGIPMVLDASQSAGVLPVRAEQLPGTAFIAMPGHKGLYGPQGTGLLLCCGQEPPHSLMQGGTGSDSLEVRQPEYLPDALESGTLNVPGIAGLREGIRFVQKNRPELREREERLCRRAAEGLGNLPGMQVWYNSACQSGVLSFRMEKADPSQLCDGLAQRGVCLRSGLHCSPLAHRSAGTLPEGTVRASFSAFNTPAQVERFLQAAREVVKTL